MSNPGVTQPTPVGHTIRGDASTSRAENGNVSPALPMLRPIERLTRCVIRGGWALAGLLGFVVQSVATLLGALLALAVWSLTILLGAAAIANFVQWVGLGLHH